MDIDPDHEKFHASVPVQPMPPRRLCQAEEPWTTENSRPKQKIPPEEADNHQIKWTKKYYINCRSHTATTIRLAWIVRNFQYLHLIICDRKS